MSLLRWSPRRDESEGEVVATFLAAGALVMRLSGKGVPDLLVGFRRHWVLVEVKTGLGKLRPAQRDLLHKCLQMHLPVAIVHSSEEALELLNTLRTRTADVQARGPFQREGN